jgi:hypothetical protein
MGDCICVRRGDGPEGCGICNETGTTPGIAGLCKRLRNTGLESAAEAADTLERQAAEIERLRGAAQAANRIRITALVYEDADLLEDIEMVLAALTGEDPGGTG